MNRYGSLSDDEWARVLASPLVVGMAITAAEPSGVWGILKESTASGWALLQSRQSAPSGTLVRAIADAFGDATARTAAREHTKRLFTGVQPKEITKKAINEVRETGDLVRAKAPAEFAAYSDWLQAIAQKAAEASAEGGFLGFGGVQVSDAEKATLEDIRKALAPLVTPGQTA